jgi:hydrogenase expression/formation protein HypE
MAWGCPAPLHDERRILLAHGGGGRLTQRLFENLFGPAFRNPLLDARHDGALLPPSGASRLAFTTDSYVVRPLFFPGGDIGSLSVNGTVNDLAMCGARPLALSAAFVLEEGFPVEDLERIVASMRLAAAAVGVPIVTGDTKVVERGKGDGVFVTTSGIGLVAEGVHIAPGQVRQGDAVLVSGDIGRHGVAVLAAREGLAFETTIESDCAPLVEAVFALLDDGISLHCLRDLTRGGLASALVEVAQTAGVGIEIIEDAVPVQPGVRGACEILGFDPLYLANEGRFVAFAPARDAARAVERLRALDPLCAASIVGQVQAASTPGVTGKTAYGGRRAIEMMSGEQLPRIC